MANAKPAAYPEQVIYCKYIVRKGKRIYPKRAKAFRFILKKKVS